MRLLLPLAAVLMASMLGAQTPTTPEASNAPAPRGSADNGKKLFTAKGCYECHNYTAAGGVTGPRLAPRPIPFPAFTKAIREPRDEMVPYTTRVLTDQEVADIYAFLLTIPAPPARNTIPLLNN
jgi:mono/diheme cytochrome c family protein